MRPLLPVALCLAACSGAPVQPDPPPPPPAAVPHDAELAGLEVPGLLEERSDAMRQLWELSEQALSLDPPDPPGERGLEAVNGWMRSTLQSWIERKTFAVQAAEAPLADVTEEEEAPAGALVALLYEQLARQLASIPLAREVEADPAVQQRFSRSVEDRVLPLVGRALEGLALCRERSTLPWQQRWRAFCEELTTEIGARWGDPPAATGRIHPELARQARAHAEGPRPAGPEACWAASQERRGPVAVVAPPAPVVGEASGGGRPRLGLLLADPLVTEESAPLDEAERARVLGAVHARLRALPARLLPLTEADRNEQAHAADGCGRTRAEVFASRRPDAWLATALPTCRRDACRLDVYLRPPPAGAAAALPARLGVEVEGFDGDAFVTAAAALAETPLDGAPSLEMAAPLGSDHELELLAVAPHGDWGEVQRGRLHPALVGVLGGTSGEAIETCRAMGGDAIDTHGMVIAIGEDGAVTGAWNPYPATASERRECLREVISGLRFSAGAAGRRLVLAFAFGHGAWTPRDYRYGRLDRRAGVRVHVAGSSEDPRVRADLPVDDPELRAAVARCHARHRPDDDGAVGLRVSLSIAQDGAVATHDVERLDAEAPGAFEACVADAVAARRFRCPDVTTAAELVICVGADAG